MELLFEKNNKIKYNNQKENYEFKKIVQIKKLQTGNSISNNRIQSIPSNLLNYSYKNINNSIKKDDKKINSNEKNIQNIHYYKNNDDSIGKINQCPNFININKRRNTSAVSKFDNENPIIQKRIYTLFNKENKPQKKSKSAARPKTRLFSIYFYFMDILLDNLIQPKTCCLVSKRYLIVYNFMSQLYDISSYVLLYEQFTLLKKTFLLNKINVPNQDKKLNIMNQETLFNISYHLRSKKSTVFDTLLLLND